MSTSPTPFVPSSTTLNLATWVPTTTAEGPGNRFALWVQGCAIRCEQCCNPDMFAFSPKQLLSVDAMFDLVMESKERHGIQGITCLGGEPFSQAGALATLAENVQEQGLSVMVFSGHVLEELRARDDDGTHRFLNAIDILVDGPYMVSQHTNKRRWIGSNNQRIHFLTERYDPNDPAWKKPNTVEIHYDGKEILVAGFPEGPWAEKLKHWNRWSKKMKRPSTPSDENS